MFYWRGWRHTVSAWHVRILVILSLALCCKKKQVALMKNHTRKDQFSFWKTRIFLNICSDNGLLKRAYSWIKKGCLAFCRRSSKYNITPSSQLVLLLTMFWDTLYFKWWWFDKELYDTIYWSRNIYIPLSLQTSWNLAQIQGGT